MGGSRNRKNNILSWVHPAYGGKEVLQLRPLYLSEEGFEEKVEKGMMAER
jgi:hypothetical protein